MTRARGFACGMLALALAGCGGQSGVPAATATATATSMPAAPGFDVLRLARTNCYGECPVYQVEIRKDGSATFTGEAHVKAKGRRRAGERCA